MFAFVLTVGILSASGGCDADADTSRETPIEGTLNGGCQGEPVACLDSCFSGITEGLTECRDGMWSCASGVRAALCCDPVDNPDACDTWSATCSETEPCGAGYTCVKSRTHPVPAADGFCRFGDLSIPDTITQCDTRGLVNPGLLPYMGTSPVKVQGVVTAEVVCENETCSEQNPCCQTCAGSLEVELVDPDAGPDAERFLLPIRTESVACAGTNCGYSCYPLQPGRRYTLWGLYVPAPVGSVRGMLYYTGHCDE